MKLQELIRDGYLFLDGAMGTELQAAGLKLGERPELLCFTAPETVAAIHRRYIAAGSPGDLRQHLPGQRPQAGGHRLYSGPGGHPGPGSGPGRRRGTDTLVAFDCGPIGTLLEPLGTLRFDDAYDLYREMVGGRPGCGSGPNRL